MGEEVKVKASEVVEDGYYWCSDGDDVWMVEVAGREVYGFGSIASDSIDAQPPLFDFTGPIEPPA